MVCPECDRPLSRAGKGTPKASKRAVGLFIVAGVVGALWALAVALWSPAFLVPRGVGGIAICALFYLGPGIAIGAYASSLPKIRNLRCARCGWAETRQLG